MWSLVMNVESASSLIKINPPNMAWLAEDDPRTEVLKTGFRSRKRMFTISFNTQGAVAVDILQEKAAISAKYYTELVLPQVQ